MFRRTVALSIDVLLCVGAALDFRTARAWIRPVAISSTLKFLAMPLAGLAVAALAGALRPIRTAGS